MRLHVSAGTGEGSSALSAFDEALHRAGVADHNLILLSSVIPPGSEICVQKWTPDENGWGNRLYVVLAERRETTPGAEAWAGLGWAQQTDGRGVFAEHIGSTEAEVVQAIHATTSEMASRRRGEWRPLQYLTAGIRCRDKPVCALVVATYVSRPWR